MMTLFVLVDCSVLLPIFFSLYLAHISCLTSTFGLCHHCYTEDTQLYSSCHTHNRAALKDKTIRCTDMYCREVDGLKSRKVKSDEN